MNLKSILGLKATPAVSPEAQAIADRVSTAAGCQALIEDMTQQQQVEPNLSRRASLLRRQLEELARIQKGHAIADDRQRAAAAVKRDMDSASKSLKAAESRLKLMNDAARQDGAALAERAALVDRLNQELTELHAAADKAVDIALSGFNDAVTAKDQESETAAVNELRKAQQNRATCGESLTTRIKAHEAERQRLERESVVSVERARMAQDDVNLARLQLARVEYDQAVQTMVDAFTKLLSLPKADSSGRSFSLSTIHQLEVTVANPERVTWGGHLFGESGRLRGYLLADLTKALKPADLELLSKQAEEVALEEHAAKSDTHGLIPGSIDWDNAQAEAARVAA